MSETPPVELHNTYAAELKQYIGKLHEVLCFRLVVCARHGGDGTGDMLVRALAYAINSLELEMEAARHAEIERTIGRVGGA
jgi:hypothetical protein